MITIENLKKIRDQYKPVVEFRKENSPDAAKVMVCMGTSGIAAGAREVLLALVAEVADKQIHHVIVTQTGAAELPGAEPVLKVTCNGETVTYVNVTPEKALRILHEHVVQGTVVSEYTLDAANAK
ncbi:MAG TPA: (2Fe-2S) ferredoxin domain-containing protein [Clostridiales bacterium]|nr:(2Fe-2S) ferredoxin domain-containing protein [Clostridiales bacterium]